MTKHAAELDTTSAVLAFARVDRAIADRAEANCCRPRSTWAAMHSVDSIDEAETLGAVRRDRDAGRR